MIGMNRELLCVHCGGFYKIVKENVHVRVDGAIYTVNLYQCNSGEHELVGDFSAAGYLPSHPKYELFREKVELDVTIDEKR